MFSNKKFLLLLVVFVFAFINITLLGVFLSGKNKPATSQYISSIILEVTQPVYTLTGVISSVKNDELTLEVTPLAQTNKTSPAKPFLVKVGIQKNAAVTKTAAYVPYLIKNQNQNPNTPVKASKADLIAGNRATLRFDKDIRNVKPEDLWATSINVYATPNQINGTISVVNGPNLQIKAVKPGNSLSLQAKLSEVTYDVLTNNETEISARDISGSKSIPISELKAGNLVVLYSKENPEKSNKVTALLINPIALPEQPDQNSNSLPSVDVTITQIKE